MRRILTAAILLPLFWALVKVAPPWAFYAVAAAGVARSAWEAYRLLEGCWGGRPFRVLGVAACLAVVWSFLDLAPRFPASLALVAVVIAAASAALWRRADPREMMATTAGTVFPVLLVGLTLAHAVALRGLPGEDGEDVLMLLLVCVVAADTAAYYVGSAWGRRPLAPRVSPHKSWEGVWAGAAASVAAAALARAWFYHRLPLGHALVLGAVLAGAAVLGDLSESVLKRACGAKDASSLLPGHGGLLDRADSLLFTGPVLYYYYRLFLWSLDGSVP